jgi:putative DNA primase/helicase
MPSISQWQKFCKEMPSEGEQQNWLISFPSGNLGLPLGPASGLAMVDIDVEDPATIEAIRACLPCSPFVRIGKKGMQLAFRHHPAIKSFKLKGADGAMAVEYLSTGNQCVLPGSIHPDTGQPYTANCNLWDVLDQIPATPTDIRTRLERVLGVKPSKAVSATGAKPVAEGGRHGALLSEAGRLRNKGLETYEELLAALHAYNEAHCNPPQDASDVDRIARDAVHWSGGDGLPFNDLGNAKRLVKLFEARVRYDHARKMWLVFDGVRWCDDTDGQVTRLAMGVAANLYETAGENPAQRKGGFRAQSAGAIKNMIELAKSLDGVPVRAEEFDQNPYLLNTPTGVCDLRDGSLRPAQPDDYLTKCTAVGYDPEADCPRWLSFLEEVFPDQALREFMQPLAGYVATGLTREHIGIFALGSGRNGKGVTFNTLAGVLGSYTTNTSYATFMQSRTGGATPELAALQGARLVLASEGNRGQRLDSALFKSMTGGDPITARSLWQAPVTFQPQFAPLIVSNHMPEMDGNDPALWARVVLVPFARTFDAGSIDRNLSEALKSEWAGILRWLVEGAVQYLAHGLQLPAAVTEAVAAYRGEMDLIGTFIDECCIEAPEVQCSSSLLYQEFEGFARELGQRIPSRTEFGNELGRRGYAARKSGVVYRRGLTLRPVQGWNAAA